METQNVNSRTSQYLQGFEVLFGSGVYGTRLLIGLSQNNLRTIKKPRKEADMFTILCIIAFPFVVLAELMKMNK